MVLKYLQQGQQAAIARAPDVPPRSRLRRIRLAGRRGRIPLRRSAAL